MSIPTSLLGIAGAVASSGIVNPASHAIAGWISAATLPFSYDAGSQNRTSLPGIQEYINAWMNREISDQSLLWGMAFNNASLYNENQGTPQKVGSDAWRGVINAVIPKMGVDQLLYCYWSGILGAQDFNTLIKKYSIKDGHWEPLSKMAYAKFDLNIILANYFRGIWGPEEVEMRIRRFLGCDALHARDLLSASKFIPPPTDLIRFGVRDVFNDAIRKEYDLDAEYDENKDMVEWFAAQGIGKVTINPKQPNEKTRDIPRDYWAAHWQLPSPMQGYEFLHRLRPNRIDRYAGIIPGIESFQFDKLNILLKRQDFEPKYRKWLAAISYSLPQLRDIRRMYQKDIIDDQEMKEKLKDRGYNDADTNELFEFWKLQKKEDKDKEDEKKHAKAYGKYRQEILAAYKQGSVSRSVAFNGLLETDIEVLDANIMLDSIDIAINREKVKSYIDMVKAEFFLGLYDGLEAYFQLVSGGVNEIRANSIVQLWNRKLSRPRRVASSAKLVEWYGNGWLNQSDLLQRLTKLGWDNADIILYISEAEQKLAANKAKYIAIQAKTEKERAAAARQLFTQARADRLAAIQDFSRHSSFTDMKNWYNLGYIDRDEINNRLVNFMGWSIEDAARQVATLNGVPANE